MRNVLSILFMMILFPISGCGLVDWLDGQTIVDGQVINAYSGKPVPYSWVAVYGTLPSKGSSSIMGWGSGGPSQSLVRQKQTDENGKFSFRFESDKEPLFILAGIKQDEYFNSLTEENVLKADKKNNIKVKFKQPWPIKFVLKDIPPRTKMMVTIPYKYQGTFYPAFEENYFDIRDTTLYSTLRPSIQNYPISYSLTDYTTGAYQRVTVFVNFPVAEDTIKVEINY